MAVAGAASARSCAPTTGSTAPTRARTRDELTDVLRDAWKFDGMVMSDWGALHSTVKAAPRPGWTWRCRAWRTRANPEPDRPALRRPYFDSQAQGRRAQPAAVPESTLERDGHAHPHRDVPDRAVRPPAARPGRRARTRTSARRRTSPCRPRSPPTAPCCSRTPARALPLSTRSAAGRSPSSATPPASTRRPRPAGRPTVLPSQAGRHPAGRDHRARRQRRPRSPTPRGRSARPAR